MWELLEYRHKRLEAPLPSNDGLVEAKSFNWPIISLVLMQLVSHSNFFTFSFKKFLGVMNAAYLVINPSNRISVSVYPKASVAARLTSRSFQE